MQKIYALIALLIISTSITAMPYTKNSAEQTTTIPFTGIITGQIHGPIQEYDGPIYPAPHGQPTEQPTIQTGRGGGATWGLTIKLPSCATIVNQKETTKTYVYKGSDCWKEFTILNNGFEQEHPKTTRFEQTKTMKRK